MWVSVSVMESIPMSERRRASIHLCFQSICLFSCDRFANYFFITMRVVLDARFLWHHCVICMYHNALVAVIELLGLYRLNCVIKELLSKPITLSLVASIVTARSFEWKTPSLSCGTPFEICTRTKHECFEFKLFSSFQSPSHCQSNKTRCYERQSLRVTNPLRCYLYPDGKIIPTSAKQVHIQP